MLNIKKFEISYGSYFGSNEELVWHDGQLLYRYGRVVPEKEVIIDTDETVWKTFLAAVEGIVVDWKRYYNGWVCDGLTWHVEITTDTLHVTSGGNHHFPEHYDAFLQHVRSILRCRKFARGHAQSDYLVTGATPHSVNRNIRHFLRRKRLSLQKLADCLNYSKHWVSTILNATSTFEIEDLCKIAWFLDVPLPDLLYETARPTPSRSETVILELADLHGTGLHNPVTDFRKDLPDLIKIEPTRMS